MKFLAKILLLPDKRLHTAALKNLGQNTKLKSFYKTYINKFFIFLNLMVINLTASYLNRFRPKQTSITEARRFHKKINEKQC